MRIRYMGYYIEGTPAEILELIYAAEKSQIKCAAKAESGVQNKINPDGPQVYMPRQTVRKS